MTAITAYSVLLAVSSSVVTAYLNCGKGAESNCCDKHESCSYWAGIKECKKNPKWMLSNCQLACRACKTDSVPSRPSTQTSLCGVGDKSSCCDKHKSCAHWAANNECKKNPKWMLANCQRSCEVCKTDSVATKAPTQTSLCGTGDKSGCCDKVEHCALWARNNQCKSNPNYMLRNCQLSCNACSTDSIATKPSRTLESCSDNGMTREQRQKFLDMHNNYRSMVAKGQAKDAYGGNAPRAARMKKMVYDCDIEESAMRHAKRCYFAHSPAHERENLGENLYYTSELRVDKIQAAEQSIKAWFDELAQYGVGQENVLTEQLWNRPRTQIGHYTQMVWQDTYKLGCYVEWCSSMTYVVCQYGPKGNWLGDLIYEKGNSCTTDADCKCGNCKCSKEEALCIVQ
ncbi:hypothetical protein Y032_0340g2994 [Ancylostoma ceylanicum]|uniref:ShKT domain-containing protein n=1 Tax=Ancylostoma ceylanicum TaxID=53326 RepID=A0A016RXW0_9BILA|nr:hypothetical protein Y032_0340g2994 [Ancylostoma ceylanicum]